MDEQLEQDIENIFKDINIEDLQTIKTVEIRGSAKDIDKIRNELIYGHLFQSS